MSPVYKIQVTAAANLPTRHGLFRFEIFRLEIRAQPHLALHMGLGSGKVPLIRLHSECLSGDVFGSVNCDCGDQLTDAMDRISQAGCGIVIYLRQEGRGIGIEKKIQAYALQESGLDTVDANLALGLPVDGRSYDSAVAYLRHMKIQDCLLLTNNPEKVAALRDNGIDATRESLLSSNHEACRNYLETKRMKMGHDC